MHIKTGRREKKRTVLTFVSGRLLGEIITAVRRTDRIAGRQTTTQREPWDMCS